jgi:putative membrane protein
MMERALVWLHVSGDVVWIGAILAVGAILSLSAGEPKVRGALASAVYTRLAVPAFLVAFVCGLVRLGLDTSYYLKQHHWMHPKLLFAFVVIGLHHVLGARARKLAAGDEKAEKGLRVLTFVLGAAAIATVFFAIVRVPD